jgi:hypothetical protein
MLFGGENLTVIVHDADGAIACPEHASTIMLKGAPGAVTAPMTRSSVMPVFVTLSARLATCAVLDA